jgi:predicted nucleic acid-binding protein
LGFLLDTNVLSELRKPRSDPGVRSWFEAVSEDELFLSVLTVGEIRQGVERLRGKDLSRAAEYDRWLERLRRDFADRILPVTAEVAEEWGRMNARRVFPVVDGLLAATARVHRLTLVTRNVNDVVDAGVDLLNPFSRS